MTRQDLEELLGSLAGGRDIRLIVAGRHAILGKYPGAHHLLEDDTELALLDGHLALAPAVSRVDALGPVWAGVSVRLLEASDLLLPEGWQFRLVSLGSHLKPPAWCLEPNDLAIALLAGTSQVDASFVASLIEHDLVDLGILRGRVRDLAGQGAAVERKLASCNLTWGGGL